jgi:hypothetical protein
MNGIWQIHPMMEKMINLIKINQNKVKIVLMKLEILLIDQLKIRKINLYFQVKVKDK